MNVLYSTPPSCWWTLIFKSEGNLLGGHVPLRGGPSSRPGLELALGRDPSAWGRGLTQPVCLGLPTRRVSTLLDKDPFFPRGQEEPRGHRGGINTGRKAGRLKASKSPFLTNEKCW